MAEEEKKEGSVALVEELLEPVVLEEKVSDQEVEAVDTKADSLESEKEFEGADSLDSVKKEDEDKYGI